MILKDARDRVLKDLEDTDRDNAVWSESLIDDYLVEGYYDFCRATNCIWDMDYAENLPYEGDHTGTFEEPFMALFQGVFSFTGGEWEREYAPPNAVGPSNHTAPWERDYIDTDFILATNQLTAKLLMVDRVQYDNYAIAPGMAHQARTNDARYQYTTGPTSGYMFEEDGMFVIRKVPVPAGRANAYDFTGAYGLLRNADDGEFGTSPTIVGSFGIMRLAQGHFPMGPGRGFPRRVYQDTKNVRVELFRRGYDATSAPFEIPDRYVRYVENYAKSLALEKDGPGQDIKLSQHFSQRYQLGVSRVKGRMERMVRERLGRFGEGGAPGGLPKGPAFPWPYGPSYYPGR